MTAEHANIHEAIAAVMAEVGYVEKQSKPGLNYTYAGEAALIAAVRPAMVEHAITMAVVEINDVKREEHPTRNGGTMTHTVLRARIAFIHAPSKDTLVVEALGEGADVGDKSASKAMTGAYKYALRQTFCIETGDDPDSQSSDEQAAQRAAPRGRPQPRQTTKVAHQQPEPDPEAEAATAAWKAVQAAMKAKGLTSGKVVGDYLGGYTRERVLAWLAEGAEPNMPPRTPEQLVLLAIAAQPEPAAGATP